MRLWKGDVATRTRDSGRGCAVVRGFVAGIVGTGGHVSIAVVKGAVVELAVPAVFEDVFGTELISETEDAVRMRFRGVEIVLGAFEGSELFDRKVFRELFDREVGKIVRHSIHFSSADCSPFILLALIADCTRFMDW